MEIQRVGVAGCGLMGGGIAQTCAVAGYQVVVLEAAESFLAKGLGDIDGNLSRAVVKGKMAPAEKEAVMARITGTTEVAGLGQCDLVIEAIIENTETKRALFGQLDKVCPAQTIFCSNTSSIPIVEIAAATKRPERFVGLHFFNPVPVMKLVEVIRTIQSGDEAVEAVTAFADSIGKKAIQAKDRAGFLVNLLLVPFLFDAVRALELGLGTREDIDTGMVLGCNHPMGPLTLLDFVGLDTIVSVGEILYDEFKDSKYAAPTLLKQMVRAGYYGRKSGRGFYDYSGA